MMSKFLREMSEVMYRAPWLIPFMMIGSLGIILAPVVAANVSLDMWMLYLKALIAYVLLVMGIKWIVVR